MKRVLTLCGMLLCAAAESQTTQTVPFNGTVTVTIPAIPGPAGSQGAVGPAGAQGPQGLPGTSGTNGANGKDGAPGATGTAGPAGPAGASPSVASIEAALAADTGFVKAVAAAMAPTPPPPVVVPPPVILPPPPVVVTPPPPPPPPVTVPPTASACSAVSGPLALKASAVRASGISPFTAFFDATGTTHSSLAANKTAFQDVTYTWSFGDTGASGAGAWAYGSNAGHNSTNAATGGVAAHVYITPASDVSYPVTVTATDGTNKASCQLAVTAYDPAGKNGFGGPSTSPATTCVSASSAPGAGSGGCPVGAAVLQQSNYVTALGALGNGKRVLFKCGDTFTGASYTINATKASIGAYGGCEGTTTNRPVLQANAGSITMLAMGTTSGDIRISDIVFDGGTQKTVTVFDTSGNLNSNHPYQYTFSNLDAKHQVYSWRWASGAQMALINSVAEAQTATPFINVFPNYAGTGGAWVTSGTVPNDDFLFVAGNSFTNGAPGNASYEVMRDSYASKAVISNNSMTNAGPSYATLKLHDLNFATNATTGAWSGTYSEYDVISDNYFAGSSGANVVEVSPQNPQSDERMRNIVIERNLFAGTEGYGRQLLLSGANNTVRDNVFRNASGSVGVQVAQRGIEPAPQFIEVYNNTCSGGAAASCVAFNNNGNSGTVQASNSWASNNLIFNSGAVANSGAGNAVTSNSTVTSLNPGFSNGSGSFASMSDFRPTANYSGGVTVPVLTDATGAPWGPFDLGAVHH